MPNNLFLDVGTWNFVSSHSYSVKHLKSQQSATTPLHFAAENWDLEVCKLHIVNVKPVIFLLVDINLIIVHKSKNSLQNSFFVTSFCLDAESD